MVFIQHELKLIHEQRDIRESLNHGLLFLLLPIINILFLSRAVLLDLKFVLPGSSTRRVTFSLFSTRLAEESHE